MIIIGGLQEKWKMHLEPNTKQHVPLRMLQSIPKGKYNKNEINDRSWNNYNNTVDDTSFAFAILRNANSYQF